MKLRQTKKEKHKKELEPLSPKKWTNENKGEKMLKAKIKNFSYKKEYYTSKLKEIKMEALNINESPSSFILNFDSLQNVGISKWVSPKRTRSEPFARIYNAYHLSKRITIIPIMKDEGEGGDLDRINSLTLSWMNLTNVYIVLAWYDFAKINNIKSNKINAQNFNVKYINKKINEIMSYQFDAHHWNNEHFTKDFVQIFYKAVKAYEEISKKLDVKMRNRKNDHKKINNFMICNKESNNKYFKY